MSNLKKLGKGLEDISYLFISSPQENSQVQEPTLKSQKETTSLLEIPVKNICLIGNSQGFENAFLIVNLSLALARLGMKIAVLDLNEELPCLNFLLGRKVQNPEFADSQELIKEGPLGVKLIGLNQSILRNIFRQEKTDKLISILEKIEDDADLVLISILQNNFLTYTQNLLHSMREFLVMVPPQKEKMMAAYKVIKKIFFDNPQAKIGIVAMGIEHLYEVDAVFKKMFSVTKKFLLKELSKYGFLYKIQSQDNEQAHIVSFYDADLTACISNIAQIVVLRSNLAEPVLRGGSFFKKIITEFTKKI